MKCPKCQYIGFDNGERCRNCGYEFSLAVDMQALDLPIQTGDEPLGPLADFPLTDPDPPREAPPAVTPARAEGPRAPAAAGRPTAGPFDLPLFRDRAADDDAPLVTPPAVPRAPLAVRRATPVAPRAHARATVEDPALDRELPEIPARVTAAEREALAPPAAARPFTPGARPVGPGAPAAAGPRLAAAVIDALLIGSISLIVLYFTLQLTRLTIDEIHLLPRVPMAGFLLLLSAAYVVTFTAAGGQTIGKMATGIRVVPVDPDGQMRQRVPLGHAVVRAAGYLVSLLPAGLGYLPALVGHERRAIHDRLADTRVIQA